MNVGLLFDSINNNTGDKAIGISMAQFFKEENIPYDLLDPRSPIHPKNYTQLVVGGGYLIREKGDEFYDAFRVNGPYILNTIGVYEAKDAQYLNNYIYLTVRSKGDKRKLRQAGVSASVHVVPDTTMWMHDKKIDIRLDGPTIGIHLTRETAQSYALREFLKKIPYQKLFIPITHYNKDYEYMRLFAEGIPDATVYPLVSPQGLFTLIGKMDAFISTSLHGAIFAYVHNVPFILFEHEKMRFFMEDRKLERFLFSSGDDILEKLQFLLSEKPDYSSSIQKDQETLAEHKRMLRYLLKDESHYPIEGNIRYIGGPDVEEKKKLHIRASVVIPTFNGEEYLKEVLDALFSQKTTFAYEVIMIDSGSKDKTLEIASKYPIRIQKIPNTEFNHGETRNLGVTLAHGEFIAFLTQDATPASTTWLQTLVETFEDDPLIAGVYGKHIPREDCNPVTARDTMEYFKAMGPDDTPTTRFIEKGEKAWNEYKRNEGIWRFYSDVNSCLRRSIWEKIPYRKADYAEDQMWGRDVIEAGYKKIYHPKAAVIHSHNYPTNEFLKRFFDEYKGLNVAFGYVDIRNPLRILVGTVRGTLDDAFYIWKVKRYLRKEKLHWMYHALLMNFYRRLAAFLGGHHRTLPSWFKQALSLESKMKQKAKN